jgi:hypothetical protein
MPVPRSGVMFGGKIFPNGVSSAAPPANGRPPGAVWHETQSAAWEIYLP